MRTTVCGRSGGWPRQRKLPVFAIDLRWLATAHARDGVAGVSVMCQQLPYAWWLKLRVWQRVHVALLTSISTIYKESMIRKAHGMEPSLEACPLRHPELPISDVAP